MKRHSRICLLVSAAVAIHLLAAAARTSVDFNFGGDLTLLESKREQSAKTETWTLEFPIIEEDVEFRIGAPALPIAAPTAEAVLSGR